MFLIYIKLTSESWVTLFCIPCEMHIDTYSNMMSIEENEENSISLKMVV